MICFLNDNGNKPLCDTLSEEINGLLKKCGIKAFSSASVEYSDLASCRHIQCIVVPFGSAGSTSFSGLALARKFRRESGNYQSPFIFLTAFDLFVPDFLRPENIKVPAIKNLLGTPEFGNVDKATLFAEVFLCEAGDEEETDEKLLNFISLSFEADFFKRFYNTILRVMEHNTKKIGRLRRAYYDTFISYYDYGLNGTGKDESRPIKIKDVKIEEAPKLKYPENRDAGYIEAFRENMEQTELIQKFNKSRCKTSETSIYAILEFADYIHCLLNGRPLPKKSGSHSIPLELFNAPYPFPLHELVNAENEIRNELEADNRGGVADGHEGIRLLLIDNTLDKVSGKNGGRTLGDLFQEPGEDRNGSFADFFDLRMLGDTGWVKLSESRNTFHEDDETFKFVEFRKSLRAITDGNGTEAAYAAEVYNRVKEAHFILLDFFLNKENTYLAFDFIGDMAEIKRRRGDIFTTWYFITSAVYDSVVKYSKSGLLAEHYESAVVSAGDDPTNEKRRIIFVYKLLTFIQARLKSFKELKEAFRQNNVFKKDCNQNIDDCRRLHTCLYRTQSLCRKYLAEYPEISKIFPRINQEESFKENVELADNIVNQFLWLPEADWPMIQKQIEYLNIKLEKSVHDYPGEKALRFSCRYILNELEERSKRY